MPQFLFDFFFVQSRPIQALILVIQGLGVLGLSYGAMRLMGAREKDRVGLVPVAPFFVAVSTLYALFLAFHASTIWSHKHDAEMAFRDAVTAIQRLEQLLGPGVADLPAAREALRTYVDAVVREEWPTGNTKSSARADQALHELRVELTNAASALPPAVGGHLFRVFDDLVKARAERLWVGSHHTNKDEWYVVYVLGVLAHLAIAFVHIDRPRAGLVALALFALATTSAYWLLTKSVDPFAGVEAPDPNQLWLGLTGG